MCSFRRDVKWTDQPFCPFLSEAQIMRCVELAKQMLKPRKPILSPFAKNKNLIELEVFFLEIVHPDLYSGKVWGFSIFSFCIPRGEILGWLL